MEIKGLSGFSPYRHIKDKLTIFDASSLEEVENMAAGLSIAEVLDYFNLTEEVLADSPVDKTYFHAAFKRGRSIAKFVAVSSLFSQMKERNGAQPALAYLKQVAEVWPEAEMKDEGKNFSFKVIMNDKEK